MKWEMVKLGDFVQILSGFAFDSQLFSTEEGMPLIRIRDIKRGFTETFFKGTFDPAYIVKSGDILIGMDGEFNVATWTGEDALLNQRVCKIQSTDVSKLDNRYLLYFLPLQLKFIEDRASFVTVKHLSVKDIRNIDIPLPPLPIQRRIADILDKADALRRKDRALLERYDALAQSVFMDMFGDPVRNEKGWEVRKLGEGLEHLQIGPFGTQLHESDYIFDGVPVINPMHINNLKITPNPKYSIKHEKYLTLPQYHLKENDIILARRGEMGRAALVTKEGSKYLCGTGSLFLRVDKNKFEPLFLVYLLSQKSTKSALENVASGTTMPNLNKGIIYDFDVIFPDVGLQKKFIDAIIYTEQSTDLTLKSIAHSESLFQSLLQRAFKGEL